MKHTLIALFISFTSSFSYGQDTVSNYQYLMVYGQVWGFLKYHHPLPSTTDWDQTLLHDYDLIKKCKTDEEFRTIISQIISLCGNYKPNKFEVDSATFFKQSFEWLRNRLISENDRTILIKLVQNKPVFKNRYIQPGPVGTPQITNEKNFSDFKDDASIRYLAITRYWNIINYYYPYRELIRKNWSNVYREHLPDFINANTYDAYYFAVRKISTRINDAHAFTRAENHPILKYKVAPFTCTTTTDGTFITYLKSDSTKQLNLERFDRLVAVNGIPVEDKWKEVEDILPASNDYFLKQLGNVFLTTTESDNIIVKVLRQGNFITDTVHTIDKKDLYTEKADLQKKPYEFFTDSVSNKKIGYLNMGQLTYKHLDKTFKKLLEESEHLIIDSRNYPNWTLYPLAHILLKGKHEFAKITEIDFQHPGSVKWRGSEKVGGDKNGYKGIIYILVDFNTMSQAEFTVMALQQHTNSIVIGGQTAGADGNVVEIPLPYGVRSVFSGIGIYYPDKSPTQQVGIRRDFAIIRDKSSLESGQDLIYNKAMELIRAR